MRLVAAKAVVVRRSLRASELGRRHPAICAAGKTLAEGSTGRGRRWVELVRSCPRASPDPLLRRHCWSASFLYETGRSLNNLCVAKLCLDHKAIMETPPNENLQYVPPYQ